MTSFLQSLETCLPGPSAAVDGNSASNAETPSSSEEGLAKLKALCYAVFSSSDKLAVALPTFQANDKLMAVDGEDANAVGGQRQLKALALIKFG